VGAGGGVEVVVVGLEAVVAVVVAGVVAVVVAGCVVAVGGSVDAAGEVVVAAVVGGAGVLPAAPFEIVSVTSVPRATFWFPVGLSPRTRPAGGRPRTVRALTLNPALRRVEAASDIRIPTTEGRTTPGATDPFPGRAVGPVTRTVVVTAA